jgi:hypothetical protein
MIAAVGFAAALLAATAPAQGVTLPGNAARAVSMAFQIAAAKSLNGVLQGMTLHVGDQPGCYRIRFVPNADPSDATTVRLSKGAESGVGGCPDDDAAPEWVLPGVEAEALGRILRAWSTGALTGAPAVGMLADGTFSATVAMVPGDSTTLPGNTVTVTIVPSNGSCPFGWDYDPVGGTAEKLPANC